MSTWLAPAPPPVTPAIPVDQDPQKVVGGEVVADGVWPDAVALLAAGDVMCSGVLVAPDLVLTAAHCWFAEQVVVGTADLTTGGRTIAVVDSLQHEDFFNTLDVAVLFLAEPVLDIAPRTLAVDCFSNRIAANAPVDVVGFGAVNRTGTEFTPLLHAGRTTITDPECLNFEAGCNELVSPGGELIAGGDGVDSCFGDSGGPLYLLGADEDTLAGVTSRGLLGKNPPCGAGGIYVRADAIDRWLQDQGITLARPVCEGNQPPVPSAAPLAVPTGLTAATLIDPRDPDAGQQHWFEIVEPPAAGHVSLDPDTGFLVVLAPDHPVETTVTVAVTDNGVPPLTGTLIVPITVTASGSGEVEVKGCAATPAAGGLWAVGLLLATRTRRRSRRRFTTSGGHRAG